MTEDAVSFPLDPEELARAIDLPLAQWPGNCHDVADAIRIRLPVEGMRIARGHWLGPVSRKSVYHQGPQQHSWLKLADGRVLDPTRWAIVSPDRPSIYLGVCDHYDEGARQLVSRTPPPFPGSGPNGQVIAVSRMKDDKRAELARLLGLSGVSEWSEGSQKRLAQALRHAIHEDPDRLSNARDLYAFLADNRCKAMLPIDSWMRVMEVERISCSDRANLYHALPPAKDLSEQALLLDVLNHFLSVEARGDFEGELEAFGIGLEEFWDCLNRMESNERLDLPLRYLGSSKANILCLVAGEHLGQGFGEAMRVERYAESLGYPPVRFAAALKSLGSLAGYDLAWDLPMQIEPSEPASALAI